MRIFFVTLLFVAYFGLLVCIRPGAFPINKGDAFFEGDIRLSKYQKKKVEEAIRKNGSIASGESGFTLAIEYAPWDNGVVVYSFDKSIGFSHKRVIYAAMREWETKTDKCITFKKRTNERNYLEFHVGSGCWAQIGKANGKHQISIGSGCEYQHVMAHELGHAIGFWHEQSRTDRDSYLQILWGNVPDAYKDQFAKFGKGKIDSLGVPYDYTSIMHYPWNAFSTTGSDTVKPLRKVPSPGPYVHVSELDVKQTKLFYKCSGTKSVITVPPVTTKPPVTTQLLVTTEQPVTTKSPVTTKRPVTTEPILDKTTKRPSPVTKCVIEEVSCENRNRHCDTWKSQGYCRKSPKYMTENCCESCKSKGCKDRETSYYCNFYKKKGMCRTKSNKMNRCKRSCGLCKNTYKTKRCYKAGTTTTTTTLPPPPVTNRPPTVTKCVIKECKDYHRRDCNYWARLGECRRNPLFMKTKCCKSCNGRRVTYARGCRDKISQCAWRKRRGECYSRSSWMNYYCKRSCNKCTTYIKICG